MATKETKKAPKSAPSVSIESLNMKMDDLINDCETMAKGAVYAPRFHNIAKILKQVKRNNLR